MLAKMIMVCSSGTRHEHAMEIPMRQWTLAAAAFALFAAALWHLPATAQRSAAPDNPEPALAQPSPAQSSPARPAVAARRAPRTEAAAAEPITFDEYRDFRLRDIARRQARLDRELAETDLSPEERSSLEARKAYYDRLAAMPAGERDRLFRARFDQIDTDHDGALDPAERAAWRAKQRERYRASPALARAGGDPEQR
jgi:hypothetical protein